MPATVRHAFFEQLRALGITTIFGNPGSTEEPMLTDLPGDIGYVLGLQEASVVAMADGYAQATGQPALVNLHTGAGMGHAMTSIMTASLNRTPLVITAGQQTREMLLQEPLLTDVDPTTLPRPWVKWSHQTDRAQDAPAALLRAYLAAAQPPAGPVFLSFPMDDWDEEADALPAPRTTSWRSAPDPARLEALAADLRRAARPALVVGGGVDRSGAWSGAVALAEALGADVWGAPAGERVGFPTTHPLYRGDAPFAIAPLAEELEGHDVVVVLGAPAFRYYPYVPGPYLPEGTALWQVSDDPGETSRAPVGDAILADPGLAIDGLLTLLAGHSPARRPAPSSPADPPAASTPLSAELLFATLDAHRGEGTVLVEESLSNRAALHARWPVTEPSSYFTMASGALGWGLPAAVGIALAERDTGRGRPVLAVIGDGAFQYCPQALWTAALLELPLVVVVPDNHEYATLKSFAREDGTPAVPGLDLPGIDITKVAEGYGADASVARTEDEVVAALGAAARRPGPTVVVVPVDASVPELL